MVSAATLSAALVSVAVVPAATLSAAVVSPAVVFATTLPLAIAAVWIYIFVDLLKAAIPDDEFDFE